MEDIVFIVVDAMRPDGLGHLESPGDPTPTIDDVATEGISFTGAYSCINTTDPSITSIHTGQYPASFGLIHHGKQVTQEEVSALKGSTFLPELLGSHGYDTGAVDWLGRWHRRGFDVYTGHDWMHDYPEQRSSSRSILSGIADIVNENRELLPGPVFQLMRQLYRKYINPLGDKGVVEDAETTTNLAIDVLDRLQSPRYLFVHYWDVHAPYDTPERYIDRAVVPEFDVEMDKIRTEVSRIRNDDRRRYIEEILENGIHQALQEYYGAISFVDEQLDRLLDHLDDDAYIVIMADHGESLFEHGIFFEHHGLYDVNTRVPLIISGPRLPKSEPQGLIQLCDVVPTILSRNGISPPEADGIDAFGRMEDGQPLRDVVFIEEAHTQRKQAIRSREFTYIQTLGDGTCSYCGIPHGDDEQLYDLSNDRAEVRNIVDSRPNVARKLQSQLADFFEQKRSRGEAVRIQQALRSVKKGADL